MSSEKTTNAAPVDGIVIRNRLFVWEDCANDYTSGIMFAVAETVDEARKKLLDACSYIPEGDLMAEPRVFDMTESVAFVVWGGG